eukprot:10219151-Karenia_brevis.AAC.1
MSGGDLKVLVTCSMMPVTRSKRTMERKAYLRTIQIYRHLRMQCRLKSMGNLLKKGRSWFQIRLCMTRRGPERLECKKWWCQLRSRII